MRDSATNSICHVHRAGRWLSALCIALGVLVSCEKPPSFPSQAESRNSTAEPARDLTQDEAAGGHVLRKHVGLSDDELRDRLKEEPNISGASTYANRAAAERVIAAAIAANRERIRRWLDRSGGHPNLVLDYNTAEPVGRTLNRGDSQPRPCSHALIVLKYDPPGAYHVLTSYPECR